jgi:putative ABC transport system permease protein
MKLKDLFYMSIENIFLNRLRSFLAIIGIVIGVSGIIIMGIIGSSGRQLIFNEIKTFGLQTIWIYRNNSETIPGTIVKNGSGIFLDDILLIKQKATLVQKIAPVIELSTWCRYKKEFLFTQILFTTPSLQSIENDTVLQGRFITDSDSKYSRKVCVIGEDVSNKFFPGLSAIGQEIDINNTRYEVIGVLKNKDRDLIRSIGVGGGNSPNGRIIIPIGVYSALYSKNSIDYIEMSALSTEESDNAAKEVIAILKKEHHNAFDYSYTAMKHYIESANTILNVLSWILAVAVSISVIVGGIGIANIMAISVVERTREIGIRKALGASSRQIFYQFLIESLCLSGIAGIIGVLLGTLIALITVLVTKKPLLFPFNYVVLAFGVSTLVGVCSGVYPAARAAKLNPADALRWE